MAFIINCDNKGCWQAQAALLDVKTNEVLCKECGKPIQNVTHFAKVQLKSLGQTTKTAKTQQTYSVKCNHCSVTAAPVLSEGKVNCKSCSKELTGLSNTFMNLLKDVLRNEQQ